MYVCVHIYVFIIVNNGCGMVFFMGEIRFIMLYSASVLLTAFNGEFI